MMLQTRSRVVFAWLIAPMLTLSCGEGREQRSDNTFGDSDNHGVSNHPG